MTEAASLTEKQADERSEAKGGTPSRSSLFEVVGGFLRRQWALPLLLVLGVLLGLHAWYYWPFFSDDALISLRYGQRLAQGHGLTWSGGERVEGYSDLLWVLLAAGAQLLRRDLISSARTLDFLGAFAAMAFVSLHATQNRVSPIRVVSGGLALALCAPLAVWSIGGLEHGFMTGLLAAAIVVLRRSWESEQPDVRRLLIGGSLLGGLALARADGMVLVAAVAMGLMLTRRPSVRSMRALGMVLSIPVALLGAQLIFRIFYYGEWVPNTALVKVSFNTHRLLQGVQHVKDGFTPLLPMLGLAIAATAVMVRRVAAVRWGLPWIIALSWSSYVAVVGGDIFPGWRQLLLAMIPLALLIAEGGETIATRWPKRFWIVPVICIPVLIFGLRQQTRDPENIRADNEMWEWDGKIIGPMLRVAFGDKQPLLAVDAAGALPYWSRLPSLDMLCLNDKHIATHPPPTFGQKGIGHELGDGTYVLERKPDIFAFNNAGGAKEPNFLSGRQLVRLAAFKKNYQQVLVQGGWGHKPFGWLWIRREDGVLGVQRSKDRIDLPGYLFAGLEAPAVLEENSLVTAVSPTRLAKLPSLRVPRGTWRLELDPPLPQVEVGFRCDEMAAIPSRAQGSPVIRVDGRSLIDIVLGTRTGTHHVRNASLTRTTERPTFTCSGQKGVPTVSIDALSYIQEERGNWAYPTHFVMRKVGMTVRLGDPSSAPAIHMSSDNNDVLHLTFMSAGKIVGRTTLRPKPNVAGMGFQRVLVPKPAQEATYDSIRIVPASGDGKYSIGHLVLLAR